MVQNKKRCSHCNSEEVVKRGTFETKAHGKQQMLYCKKCGKRCIERTPFYRMRNEPQKITCAIDLFYRGVSTRKVQEHLSAFYPHNSSHKSIYKWIVKYAKIIGKFTDKLKVNIGSEIQIDEMEYHRRKQRNRKGVDRNWFIDSIDTKTRFMIASEYVKARENKEIKYILNKLKKKSENQVKVITTDGHAIYQNVVKKVFGYDKIQKKYNIVHNVVNASNGEGFNIMIERLHNNIRARTKTFRGFHGSIESANAIMKGYEIYYNFITRHQAIGKCPYELAIPELKDKLNVPNKWLELIELSNQSI